MTGSTRTGGDVISEIVAALAPAEVPHVAAVLRAYRLDPWPADGDGGRDRPIGSGVPVDQLAAWSLFVAGFVGQLLAEAAAERAVDATVDKATATGRRWWKRRRRPDLAAAVDAPAPTFDAVQLAQVRVAATAAATARGYPPAERDALVTAVLTALGGDTASP